MHFLTLHNERREQLRGMLDFTPIIDVAWVVIPLMTIWMVLRQASGTIMFCPLNSSTQILKTTFKKISSFKKTSTFSYILSTINSYTFFFCTETCKTGFGCCKPKHKHTSLALTQRANPTHTPLWLRSHTCPTESNVEHTHTTAAGWLAMLRMRLPRPVRVCVCTCMCVCRCTNTKPWWRGDFHCVGVLRYLRPLSMAITLRSHRSQCRAPSVVYEWSLYIWSLSCARSKRT